MKRFWIFMALLLAMFFIKAQEFTTIRLDQDTYYERNDTLYSVEFDSITILDNGDSLAFFPETWKYSKSPDCIYSKDSSFFLGDKIIKKPDDKQWLFNKYGDTITFAVDVTAPKGTAFTLMENDSQRFEAVFHEQINLPTYKILDKMQNVLVYKIFVEDSSGNLQESHPFYGKEFEIAQYFGFNITYNWYEFPKDTSKFYIAGSTMFDTITGTKGLDFNSIFTTYPGYERHYEEQIYESGQIAETQLYKLFTIDTLQRNDSIFISNRRIGLKIDAVSSDTSFINDTVIESYFKGDFQFLDKLQGQPGLYYSIKESDTLYAIVNDHRWEEDPESFVETVSRGYSYFSGNNCLSNYIKEDTMVMGENIGFIYRKTGYAGDFIEKRLIYYKKGIVEWGDPISFSNFTGISNQTPEATLTAFPNPFNNVLKIKLINTEEAELAIFNMNGKRIYNSNLRDGTDLVETDGWQDGIYFLEVSTKNGISRKKILKVGK